MFGVVKGSRVAVIVDTSDASSGFGRLTSFQEALGVSSLVALKEYLKPITFELQGFRCMIHIVNRHYVIFCSIYLTSS